MPGFVPDAPPKADWNTVMRNIQEADRKAGVGVTLANPPPQRGVTPLEPLQPTVLPQPSTKIVAMCEHNGGLVVAREDGIYFLADTEKEGWVWEKIEPKVYIEHDRTKLL